MGIRTSFSYFAILAGITEEKICRLGESFLYYVVVSGAGCGLTVCFCIGHRCQHDINEEFVDEFIKLMSVVVAICV